MLEKTSSRNQSPRPPKIHFTKKRRKPLEKRRKFKDQSNVIKTYGRKLTDYQVRIRAECARQARLRNPTLAEERFAEILTEMDIPFEREFIIQNGDRFILADFFVQPDGNRAGNAPPKNWIIFEIDGSAHKTQEKYDQGRTIWLEEKGYQVIRFTNKTVLKTPEVVKEKIRKVINGN